MSSHYECCTQRQKRMNDAYSKGMVQMETSTKMWNIGDLGVRSSSESKAHKQANSTGLLSLLYSETSGYLVQTPAMEHFTR